MTGQKQSRSNLSAGNAGLLADLPVELASVRFACLLWGMLDYYGYDITYSARQENGLG